MKLMTLLFLLVAPLCYAHDLPLNSIRTGVPLYQWQPVRPGIELGYGPIIDDLESMTRAGHPMRSTSDPGNWVHELTHQVNSDQRGVMSRQEKREYNSAYILNGLSVCLPEPNVTLAQVAGLVPARMRAGAYKLYMVDQQRWWNRQPLYVLDEATSAGNALFYQVSNGKPDNHRLGLAVQWANYSQILLLTVEQFDPSYSHLPQLRAFVQWHNSRLEHLAADHQRIRSAGALRSDSAASRAIRRTSRLESPSSSRSSSAWMW